MSILIKNIQKSKFWSKFSKISILEKIVEKSHIWSNLSKKSQFWTKLSKILHFGRNVTKRRFWLKFTEISNLVEFSKKSRFWSKLSGILDWSKLIEMIMLITVIIVEKCRFGSKLVSIFILVKNCRIISILVNIYENLDFGQSSWKSRLWSKMWKIIEFIEI